MLLGEGMTGRADEGDVVFGRNGHADYSGQHAGIFLNTHAAAPLLWRSGFA